MVKTICPHGQITQRVVLTRDTSHISRGGGSISSSGGGCSIGGHQNKPTAFADLAVMLMPLFVIIMLRIRRKKK